MRKIVVAFTLLAALGACASKPSAQIQTPPGARTIRAQVAYQCDGGLGFTAVFLANPDAVALRFASGDEILLPQVVSGSGFRYADSSREFRGKADEAQYTLAKTAPVACYVAK